MKNIYKLYDLLFTLLIVVLMTGVAMSSSHREAPLISNDPLADNVDLYAFRSPDNPDMISIIATYVPFQLPQGAPNYYNFGENVRYEIHVDNDASVSGDEITYRFTFTIVNEDPTTFFNIRLGLQNQKATYNLERSVDGGETFQMIIENGIVPPNNIGPRSIGSPVGLDSDYETLWRNSIMTASTGEQVFAGPSDDPFFVDLGGIFDLGDTPRQNGKAVDGVACYNVSTIAIQVPIATLLKAGAPSTPSNILDPDYVIGVWASASRPAITTLSSTADPSYSGDWIQVSRLGMPLTNEAVIPIGDKDYWNSITPYDEIAETTLDEYFYNPELALYMDDDQFGAAVPAFAPLRIQTNSLGAFDFSNGADGLFSLKGSDAVAGTALDDAVFGTLLLPAAGKPRSVDLWPAFHTGVPNVIPYQLATGKEGNPLAAGKPFVNNFLPNGGDMLRLNMAVPITARTDDNFSSLGLIQAAAIGLTVAPFNTTADLEFIPNMDGFPNGRRLEDDVTRIELQAVSGAVLAAVGLWYDDYDPATSPSPVTQNLLNVLGYTTGVEANDRPFGTTFPYVALPFSGTGDCSGTIIEEEMVETEDIAASFYVSSNTSGSIGVFDIREDGTIDMSSIMSNATDADGLYYDKATDVMYQLNRTDNVINAYSTFSTTPTLTATSTSDFSNGREIAVTGSKLVVAQDASDTNDGNKFVVYDISATAITLDKVHPVDFNLWGIHADGNRLFAVVDNSDQLAVFDDFFNQADGMVNPSNTVTVEGIVRTHGITYDAATGTMYLTDVGDGAVADDGAFSVIAEYATAASDNVISMEEQIRVAGPTTFLGNPVDIAFDPTSKNIFIAERANEGGRVLGFNPPTMSGEFAPFYEKTTPGASAIFFPGMMMMAECTAAGGMLSLADGSTEATICSDGTPDVFDLTLTGNTGTSIYLVTDEQGNILGNEITLPVDFDLFQTGVINLYNFSYTGDLEIPAIGGNIDQLTGCFDLSNAIAITVQNGAECAPVETVTYTASLTGTQEVQPALTMASGSVTATLTGNELVVSGSFANLSADFDANVAGGSHIHMAPVGRAGGIVKSLVATLDADLRGGSFNESDNTFTLTDEEVTSFMNRHFYVNIHTTAWAAGELRGQLLPASEGVFQTNLVGSNQSPQVVTSATGGVIFELTGNTITVSGSFQGLSSAIATDIAGGAHIHHAPAGRAGDVIRVLDLTIDEGDQGAVIEASKNTFELTDEELGWLNFNALYINVHSLNNQGGEIRGQVTPLSLASFRANLVGVQQFPPINTDANGLVLVSYHDGGQISVSGSFNDLGSDLAVDIAGGIHLHLNKAGLAGPVITPIMPTIEMSNRSAIIFPADNMYMLDDAQVAALFERGIYVNVHSLDNAGGEIRGQVLPIAQAYFATNLAGINEVQPVATEASGNVQFEWSGGQLTLSGGFANLQGDFDPNVAGGAHIHNASAGANGGIAFTLVPTLDGDNKGGVFEASNNSFALDASQMEDLANGNNYVNIHTTMFAGGELRGQILTDANQFPSASTISAPEDGATVSIDGSATSNFNVTWSSATDGNGDDVVYIWQLFSDSEASDLLLQVSTAGEPSFSTTQDVIGDLLTQVGVDDGESITVYHRAVASDGSINTPGALASVTLSRVAPVVLEGCHVPQNVKVAQLGKNRVRVSWDRVNAARNYELRIGFQGLPGSFTVIPISRNRVFITAPSDRVIELQVRAVCSRGERSEYTDIVSYTTGKTSDKKSAENGAEIRVSEIEFEGQFEMFPNPASQQVTVAYKAEVPGTTMTIYSMTGQLLTTQKLREGQEIHNLDLTAYSDGVYLINIAIDGSVVHSKKLFKTQR